MLNKICNTTETNKIHRQNADNPIGIHYCQNIKESYKKIPNDSSKEILNNLKKKLDLINKASNDKSKKQEDEVDKNSGEKVYELEQDNKDLKDNSLSLQARLENKTDTHEKKEDKVNIGHVSKISELAQELDSHQPRNESKDQIDKEDEVDKRNQILSSKKLSLNKKTDTYRILSSINKCIDELLQGINNNSPYNGLPYYISYKHQNLILRNSENNTAVSYAINTNEYIIQKKKSFDSSIIASDIHKYSRQMHLWLSNINTQASHHTDNISLLETNLQQWFINEKDISIKIQPHEFTYYLTDIDESSDLHPLAYPLLLHTTLSSQQEQGQMSFKHILKINKKPYAKAIEYIKNAQFYFYFLQVYEEIKNKFHDSGYDLNILTLQKPIDQNTQSSTIDQICLVLQSHSMHKEKYTTRYNIEEEHYKDKHQTTQEYIDFLYNLIINEIQINGCLNKVFCEYREPFNKIIEQHINAQKQKSQKLLIKSFVQDVLKIKNQYDTSFIISLQNDKIIVQDKGAYEASTKTSLLSKNNSIVYSSDINFKKIEQKLTKKINKLKFFCRSLNKKSKFHCLIMKKAAIFKGINVKST